MSEDNPIKKLEELFSKQKNLVGEIEKYSNELTNPNYKAGGRKIILSNLNILKENLKDSNKGILDYLKRMQFSEEMMHVKKGITKEAFNIKGRYIESEEETKLRSEGGLTYKLKELNPQGLEKETIKRLREREKKVIEKKKKKSRYSLIASRMFSKVSKNLLGKESFQSLERDLIKANLDYAPTGYISLIFFSTLIAAVIGGFVFLFFLVFNFQAGFPFIVRTAETIDVRFFKVFWILIVVPLATFFIMYIYPSLERRATEMKINMELPFATIHMAAISGSMINPVKIFEIILMTKEYPAIEKEFTKLLNEINIYGSDLVSALKNTAKNTASAKLAELLNGLGTTINSGGSLPDFFKERSQTLLFEHRIERQKAAKAAETFMDLYISIVIAAPMILMLLLMMMKIGGMGLKMSVGMITLMMILSVVIINIFFLTFLSMKKKGD